jgi:hypothetical protein
VRIQKAADRLEISVDWLKGLERRGVIGPIQRDIHGHRRFTEEDLERLRRTLFPPREGWPARRGGIATATPPDGSPTPQRAAPSKRRHSPGGRRRN